MKEKCPRTGADGSKERYRYLQHVSDMQSIKECKVYEVKEQELKEITGKGFEIKFRKLHYLKILEEFADAVLTGDKTFELRYNDRNYKTGDLIT